MLTFAEPTEWWLEVSSTVQADAWQQSLSHSTPGTRWHTYLNRICLNALLPWLQAEYNPEATLSLGSSAIWEVVNGMAIAIGTARLILIPSEAIDTDELAVPQEWVDIPSWVGDYYLAVQIKFNGESDGSWIRVWGYGTHQEIKAVGIYDPDDRTYRFDCQHLNRDMNALCVALQFCSSEQTKAAIAPLPELTPTEAENLIQRLGKAIAFPRLAVPFASWGALLEQEVLRQRLYQRRTERTERPQTVDIVNLSRWLQNSFETGWQTIESLMGSELIFSYRAGEVNAGQGIQRAKLIDLGIQLNRRAVVLLVALVPEANHQVNVRVQVHPAPGEMRLPNHLNLRLISGGDILQEVRSREQDNYIQLNRFRCEFGEEFGVQIVLDDALVEEKFVV